MTRPAFFRIPSVLAVAVCLVLGGPLGHGQGSAQTPGSGGGGSPLAGPAGGLAGQGIQTIPSQPFTWVQKPSDIGVVKIPVGVGSGWVDVADMLQFRFVPSFSTDPTLEVILWPPYSGHPEFPERFLLQFPMGPGSYNPDKKALVIGFHPYGVSEKSIFVATILPYLCAEQGWILLAPYGQVDTNFANELSQQALEASLGLIRTIIGYNEKKVYTVGFSMGGLNAVSFAMRHLEHGKRRVAGVINHTGTMDVAFEYNLGNPIVQGLMEDAMHFGGSPAQVPFEYDRISPFRVKANKVDPLKAPVTNLRHLPFYLHLNLQDPNTHLVQHNVALRDYLLAQGATVQTHSVNAGPQHAWATLPMREAIEWISQFELPNDPPAIDVFADREAGYFYTDVRDLQPNQHARYQVSIKSGGTGFQLLKTQALNELAFDLAGMGLDPLTALTIDHMSADSTPDTLVLQGYASPPGAVLINGSEAIAGSWSHNPLKQELTLQPSPFGTFSLVQILP